MQTLPPEVLQEHVQEHERLFHSLMDLYANGKWKVVKQKKDLISYQMKYEDSPISASRAEIIVEKSLQFCADMLSEQEAFETFMQKEMKSEKDDMRGNKEIIGEFPEGVFIYSYMNPKTKIITPRDFLLFKRKYQSNERIVELIRSIENDQLKPPTKEFIRGVMTFQASMFEKVEEGITKVIFISHFDPKGSIPVFIVNAMMKRQGEMMKMVRKFLMEQ
jgi:hypothetical protein